MSELNDKKKELLKSIGFPVDKLPESKLNLFIESIDDSFIEDTSIDFDHFIEKFDLAKEVQNILASDNSDIVNLLKQLEKLRKKKKGE